MRVQKRRKYASDWPGIEKHSVRAVSAFQDPIHGHDSNQVA
jgi:hypothetical protein